MVLFDFRKTGMKKYHNYDSKISSIWYIGHDNNSDKADNHYQIENEESILAIEKNFNSSPTLSDLADRIKKLGSNI
jgi:hypothetical protein